MSDRQSPTLRRRRLAGELRKLREAAGKSSGEVTKSLEWPPGKLTRMERAEWKRPNPRDIQDLCQVYGRLRRGESAFEIRAAITPAR
ncbi:helix-turn-helix domain-containing protein [Actinoallomurus soli]|uniref:helix-turn-helix domain-containing protein n=1 Tax=Actinoallomurus soli TaxID=2952535 RepID=UPI00209297B5|nr:helix-turn-helix transcriptional regulator [Actinoallomurus soli]MCO5974389.1 helix-turn-helix domain-containing protein [Actinoallomurus soli]